MSDLILKKEYRDKIKKDPALFSAIAICLDTTVSYLIQLINTNNAKLTQASVLRIIADKEGIKDHSELLTDIPDSVRESKSNTPAPEMQEPVKI